MLVNNVCVNRIILLHSKSHEIILEKYFEEGNFYNYNSNVMEFCYFAFYKSNKISGNRKIRELKKILDATVNS